MTYKMTSLIIKIFVLLWYIYYGITRSLIHYKEANMMKPMSTNFLYKLLVFVICHIFFMLRNPYLWFCVINKKIDQDLIYRVHPSHLKNSSSISVKSDNPIKSYSVNKILWQSNNGHKTVTTIPLFS